MNKSSGGAAKAPLPKDYYVYLIAAIVGGIAYLGVSLPLDGGAVAAWLMGVVVGALVVARFGGALVNAMYIVGGLSLAGMVAGEALQVLPLIDLSYGLLVGAALCASERVRRSHAA